MTGIISSMPMIHRSSMDLKQQKSLMHCTHQDLDNGEQTEADGDKTKTLLVGTQHQLQRTSQESVTVVQATIQFSATVKD